MPPTKRMPQSDQNGRDDVLRRMLKTPPRPHEPLRKREGSEKKPQEPTQTEEKKPAK